MKNLKLTSEIEVLRESTKHFITDLGGVVASSWCMEQCGVTVWWSSYGYVNGNCVKMSYSQGDNYITVNNEIINLIIN